MLNPSLRERSGIMAALITAVVFVLGLWGYRQTHGATEPPTAAAALAPRSANSALAAAPAAEESVVEVAAKGDEKPAAAEPPAPAKDAAPEKDAPAEKAGPLVVFVSGAVRRPGVYTFKPGERIYHAVRAAGGLKPNALQEAVNLADRLQDADQIFIPTRDAVRPVPAFTPSRPPIVAPAPPVIVAMPRPVTLPRRGRIVGKPAAALPAPPAAVSSAAPAASQPAAAAAKTSSKLKNPGDGFVNINTAGSEELQRLPGIGASYAERILAYRQQIGGFRAAEQLMDVKGIGEKKFAKMQPFVTVQ